MENREIIEKKLERAKEDLEDLELYIREFSAFLPLAVCTINPLGRIININRAAEALTGYLSFEIVGDFITDIFLEKEYWERIEKEIVEKISVRNKELTLITKENKKIPINASISLRKDREGNFIGCFMALSDITEIKNLQQGLEEKIQKRTEELRDRIDELEHFREITVGRELRIVELKNRIRELEGQSVKEK
ncbi:MAG: hypothetical protein A2V72_02035 [Candidatus Nealsonbacteria bacterium RBG_13_37_56]|uniref:PAC domain-containing protein n=1 Tax=Candidatus Nealsonbacteria bacterium RBG_13_37_56 TaxID=1801661 RepID=A0A1G2DYM3_9BACT|nr:MAG: hypothetical protein A2V72_02035 [Candidatus Nealsonbacteria bacterium RBG_13_37_56]